MKLNNCYPNQDFVGVLVLSIYACSLGSIEPFLNVSKKHPLCVYLLDKSTVRNSYFKDKAMFLLEEYGIVSESQGGDYLINSDLKALSQSLELMFELLN